MYFLVLCCLVGLLILIGICDDCYALSKTDPKVDGITFICILFNANRTLNSFTLEVILSLQCMRVYCIGLIRFSIRRSL